MEVKRIDLVLKRKTIDYFEYLGSGAIEKIVFTDGTIAEIDCSADTAYISGVTMPSGDWLTPADD